MGLETATFISELVGTNPAASDQKSQGDDHLRLIKDVLQATFPNASRAFYFPSYDAKSANFAVGADEQNRIFYVDTDGGNVTATLPTLVAEDFGWQCSFVNVGGNVMFIAPASGTVFSGGVEVAKARRAIPLALITAYWAGSTWLISRALDVPIGVVLDLHAANIPQGFEWPNGQTLASASTDYAEFYAINGNSGVTLDIRGRVVAGRDDMGGSAANRLTGASGGVAGTYGAAGGSETHTLTEAQLASHSHGVNGNTGDQSNDHTHSQIASTSTGSYSAGGSNGPLGNGSQTGGASTGHTHAISLTSDAAGSGSAHNNVQPTIVLNKILVVE